MEHELTPEEKKAIAALKRLEKIWPDTLWLFCDGNAIRVMRTGENGERVYAGGISVDPDYIVADIYIHSEGGDF